MRAISAAAKLDKTVMDVNRQVSAASTAPLRDEPLRFQISALTRGAFPVARLSLPSISKGKSQMVRADHFREDAR